MREDHSEFVYGGYIPRVGLTSVQAVSFLKTACPDIAVWTVWTPDHAYYSKIVASAGFDKGGIGAWRWERVASAYPAAYLFKMNSSQNLRGLDDESDWTGIVRIMGPEQENFLLFSFLSSNGSIGNRYVASTADKTVLERFSRAVRECFRAENTDDKIDVRITNGHSIYLDAISDEKIFLPPTMRGDIEQQVTAFFSDQKAFTQFQIPYRRGFLFVGVPGCGKTMAIRHLVRLCNARFKLKFWSLNIKRNTDEDDVGNLFEHAARNAPGMVILEDLDSLTKEAKLTRSALLNQLDGLKPREGLLVIGTTNNPQDIDPALIHRPSRFDRVWLFELPDKELRKEYLAWALKDAGEDLLEEIARNTKDWSFAYLNELRTTSAILAIQGGHTVIGGAQIRQAFSLLTAQFKSGQKGHASTGKHDGLGFEAA
jgi:hypothetical protein